MCIFFVVTATDPGVDVGRDSRIGLDVAFLQEVIEHESIAGVVFGASDGQVGHIDFSDSLIAVDIVVKMIKTKVGSVALNNGASCTNILER